MLLNARRNRFFTKAVSTACNSDILPLLSKLRELSLFNCKFSRSFSSKKSHDEENQCNTDSHIPDELRNKNINISQRPLLPRTRTKISESHLKSFPSNLYDYQSMSLSGSGFLGIYVLGACEVIQERYGSFIENVPIGGASAGSVIAAAVLCQVPLAQIKEDLLKATKAASKFPLGPASPHFDINQHLRDSLQRLPHDAHELINDRLFVSLTKSDSFSNVIISQWSSKDELIQSLICSCFLPLYSGFERPSFRGVKYIDGGYTCNLPQPVKPCLTISPFYGNQTINPVDSFHLGFISLAQQQFAVSHRNIVRFKQALFPPSITQLEELYRIGCKHGQEFLQNMHA